MDSHIAAVSLAVDLQNARHTRGWSQAELARRAGVSRHTVVRLEQGKVLQIPVETLQALADALGHSLSLTFYPSDASSK